MKKLFAMTKEPCIITDNLDQLLAVLPASLAAQLDANERARLLEIVMDLGRIPEARYVDQVVPLGTEPITRQDLDHVESRVGLFGDDNRAGIEATLHRISAIRNRRGIIVGLTLRIGRAVSGIVDIVRDVIEHGESVLVMGRPGLGKTTLLREMARVLADELFRRVVIVDTSNEIAGDGDVPHPAIGSSRRMQVARVDHQHDVMIEAVENHMPEVIVIDEIGRQEEALAARTIAERGVQLIATVHGNTLENLLANPVMSDLVGGVQTVTLSDEEARRRRTQKSVLERKAPPTFDVVIEMIDRNHLAVHRDVAAVVDALLRGQHQPPQLRWRDAEGNIIRQDPVEVPAPGRLNFDMRSQARTARPSHHDRPTPHDRSTRGPGPAEEAHTGSNGTNGHLKPLRKAPNAHPLAGMILNPPPPPSEPPPDADEIEADEPWYPANAVLDVARVRRVYPFGLSRSRLGRAIKQLGLPLQIVRSWQEADAVFMLAGNGGLPPDTSLLREARENGLPIVGVEGNTYAQIISKLGELWSGAVDLRQTPRQLALREAQQAAQRVLATAAPAELRPQVRKIRQAQHQIAARLHVRSTSIGREPHRRVKFYAQVPVGFRP